MSSRATDAGLYEGDIFFYLANVTSPGWSFWT